jgi:AbrB family looped-hinge helix DNA binding protein
VPTVTLTAKRQATLPKELCEDLGVGPGDRLDVEARVIDGETLWVLRPRKADWSWIGSLKPARGISHDWDDIERSIEQGRVEDLEHRR